MKLSKSLKKLIYGYSNIILVDFTSPAEIVKEIELMRSASAIEGWIFRPNFAKGTEFVEYSDADYMAIYAQWSLTFGWSDLYEEFTHISPKKVLKKYKKDYDKDLTPLFSKNEQIPTVKTTEYIYTIAKELVSSKAVLTNNQIAILMAMPKKVQIDLYENVNIPIKETKILLAKTLMENDSKFNPFDKVDNIIPLVVALYNRNDKIERSQLTPSLLKTVKIRIPTSAKRKILTTLCSNYKNEKALINFKKFQSFWKVLLRELRINTFYKTTMQYPEIKDIHSLVYSNIKTKKTDIEKFRKEGLLAEAFLLEMENVGEMIRNISFYLRNRIGMTYPTKIISSPKKDGFFTLGEENKTYSKKVLVKTDVSNIINSDKFFNTLLTANPKLLLQLKSILNEEKNFKEIDSKFIDSKRHLIEYSSPIPALDKEMVAIVLKKVSKVYSVIKKEANVKLGKVYIDDSLLDRMVSFSGRLDTGTVKSGQYLSVGSKISIPEMMNEDKLIRYGVSWKSRKENPDLSICIDPSVHFLNGPLIKEVVNWQSNNNNITTGQGDIVISSSGDITTCTHKKFSTELVDIDTNKLVKMGTDKFFTAIINYHFPEGNFKDIETYVFFNVIDRKDRVVGTRLSIPLDEMDYSYEVNDDINGQIGLLFDLTDNTVEVVKMSFNVCQSDSATQKDKGLKDLLKNRGEMPNIYDSLLSAIYKKQIVKKDKADLILDDKSDFALLQSILL